MGVLLWFRGIRLLRPKRRDIRGAFTGTIGLDGELGAIKYSNLFRFKSDFSGFDVSD